MVDFENCKNDETPMSEHLANICGGLLIESHDHFLECVPHLRKYPYGAAVYFELPRSSIAVGRFRE